MMLEQYQRLMQQFEKIVEEKLKADSNISTQTWDMKTELEKLLEMQKDLRLTSVTMSWNLHLLERLPELTVPSRATGGLM